MMNADVSQSVEVRRLKWRCRRGMLELDMVLSAFLTQYPQLTQSELKALDGFLELPDQLFWALISHTPNKAIETDKLTTDEKKLIQKIHNVSHGKHHNH